MKNTKRDNSTGADSGPTDSLFQSVDGDTDQYLSLAEYIGWVEKTKGEAVVKNATLLDMWIQKFERYVSLLWAVLDRLAFGSRLRGVVE